jgi:predicted RNase H-like HicB family nuclease
VDGITISISVCTESGSLVALWDDPAGVGGLTTQGETLAELEDNVREAVAVHFEAGDAPKTVRLHFVDDPVLAAA